MPQPLIAVRLEAGTVDLTSTAQDRACAAIHGQRPKGAGLFRAACGRSVFTIGAEQVGQCPAAVPGIQGRTPARVAASAFRTPHRARQTAAAGGADAAPTGRTASQQIRLAEFGQVAVAHALERLPTTILEACRIAEVVAGDPRWARTTGTPCHPTVMANADRAALVWRDIRHGVTSLH